METPEGGPTRLPGRPARLPGRPGRGIQGWVWLLIRLAVVAGILWFVVEKNGRGRIIETLVSARLSWVLAAAGAFFLSILAGAYQWFLLLRLQGIEYGYAASFRTYYSGMFLNNFLPGTVGGDALRIYEVQKTAEGWAKPVAATFLDRLMGFFSLSFLSLVAVLVTHWKGNLDQSAFRHLLLAVGLVFACFVLVLVLLLSRRISSLAHAVIRWTTLKWLDESYARLQETLMAYQARRRRMGFILLVSCLVQVLRINVHWFSALGLGVDISPVFFYCFIPVIALAGVIPLSVGGWGLPQSIATYLYTLPGVLGPALPAASGDIKVTAAALAFLPSVVGLVVMLGGGFYFVSGKPGKKRG